MGIAIKSNSGAFSNAIRYRWPLAKSLAGRYLLGGSEAESIKNRVPAGVSATKVGSPSYLASYADTTYQNGFDTGIKIQGDYTFVAVVMKRAAAGGSYLVGNMLAGVGQSDFLWMNTKDSLMLGSSGLVSLNIAALTAGKFYFVFGRQNGLSIDCGLVSGGLTPAVQKSATVVQGSRVISDRAQRIGATHDSTSASTATSSIADAMIWKAALTDIDLIAAYTLVREDLQGRVVLE
jgi:hypothetical protein